MTKPTTSPNTDSGEDGSLVIKIGGVEIKPAARSDYRIAMLLWGLAGTGKTTLACTAPGRKLIVNFDANGPASVTHRDDVDVLDLSDAKPDISAKFRDPIAPLGLSDKLLEPYGTVIIDSVTNALHLAMMAALGTSPSITLENPGLKGWGFRSARGIALVKNMLAATGRLRKHVILIAHEGAPERNDQGQLIGITMSAGGKVLTDAPKDFSEVWAMEDTGKERRIAIRPCRMRKPMKTRMFRTDGSPEFVWKHTGSEIADWYEAWKEGGWQKIALPK